MGQELPKVSGKSPKEPGLSPADATLNSVTAYVGEAVDARRRRGRKVAIAEVARLLGFSERRVRAYVDREVRQVLAWELLQVQARQKAEMEERLQRLDDEAALLRARLSEFAPA